MEQNPDVTEEMVEVAYRAWVAGPIGVHQKEKLRAALIAALASWKEAPSAPTWAHIDVIPLGDQIDRLIDGMFDESNQTAASELRSLLWNNKVGICRLLQSLASRQDNWRTMESAPKDEMFIWARPNGAGEWSLGLAYRNVSGGWSDAYGDRSAPYAATHWCALPSPPHAGKDLKI